MPTTPELDPAAFARALQREQARRDLSQRDLARLIGVTQQTVSDWLSQKKAPSKKNWRAVLDRLGLDERALMSTAANENGVILIPHDGNAAAGGGAANGSHTQKRHPYPSEVIQQLTGFAPASELRSFTIIGDSHVPEITPNTPAIYRSVNGYVGDGLYVLHVDGLEVCKILQYLPGGAIILSSYNERYRDVHLTPLPDADTPGTFREDETRLVSIVQIVGKVVFYPKPA
jgi:phage repressor protein C with HTH and peptisase S24 domain